MNSQNKLKLLLVSRTKPTSASAPAKICVSVKYTTKMKKVKDLYSSIARVPITSFEFIFNGQMIKDNETPEDLHMKHEDVIKVTGDFLTLRVISEHSGLNIGEIHFRLKSTTQLGKLKKSYSKIVGIHVSSLIILFNGKKIKDYQTPKDHDIKEKDVIKVYLIQSGNLKEYLMASLKAMKISPLHKDVSMKIKEHRCIDKAVDYMKTRSCGKT